MEPAKRTFASFYDFYDQPEGREDQIAAYVDLVRESGDPVLELACGTGIITFELARAVSHVTGLDISANMLSVARQKLSDEQPAFQRRVKLVEGDMADFDLGQEFQTILIPNNSLGYLIDTEAHKSCLAAVHRQLSPGGTVMIEERQYTPDTLTAMQARRSIPTIQAARINPATGKYTTFHWVIAHIDVTRQIIFSRVFIEEVQDDQSIRRFVPEDAGIRRTHYFNRFELQFLLEQAGFGLKHLWGGYDKERLTAGSRSMIFVAEKL